LCIYLPANSQQEFAPIGAEWYYTNAISAESDLSSYVKYQSVGDTLIEGKNCRIVEGNDETYFLYEENSKVYYFKNSFNLIYDFTASVGDTITFSIVACDTSIASLAPILCYEYYKTYNVMYTVKNIDTIIVNNIPLKQYETVLISCGNIDNYFIVPHSYIYIENIGYEKRFIYETEAPTAGHTNYLRCYNDKNILYTSDRWAQYDKACDYLESTSSNTKTSNITIYPNPFKDAIFIEPSTGFSSEYTISIFDCIGNNVLTNNYTEKGSVDTKSLQQGLYFIHIAGNNGSVLQYSFMKQ